LRVLGGAFALAVTVGGTIGVGILRAPALVAAHIGGYWPILSVWLLGGLYVLIAAFSVAELAAMLPQAGGFYVYTRRALGDGPGFVAGWVDWLTQCADMAYLAVSMAEFGAALWPALPPVKAVACGVILLFCLLHWRGVRTSGRIQEATCLLQFCAFAALTVACFAWSGQAPLATNVAPLPKATGALWGSLVLGLRLAIGTYDGWYSAIYFSEEVKNPGRILTRSMLAGVALVTVLYTLVNAALLHVLPIPAVAASPLPAADVAKVLFGPAGGAVITVLALLSLPAVLNATLLCGARIAFAMSRDGLIWAPAATVTARGTPLVALVVTGAASLLFAISGTFEQLLTLVAVLNVATYGAALLSLLVLRRREPQLTRPFEAKPYPWVTIFALAGGCAFLIGAAASDPRSALLAMGLALISYPAYRLARRLRGSTIKERAEQ
jgi:APA family basic amino acid/polyamine antiporter